MCAQQDKQRLAANQQRLTAFIEGHPELLAELFCFTEPAVRAAALAGARQLDLHSTTVLCDRILYLSRTRIVHVGHEAPRCGSKVIYDEAGANRKAHSIWNTGRGRMRVYHCPHCQGYHLTHKAHKDSDSQAA